MNLCVFAGSSFGRRPAYREAAEALGRVLAARGVGLVYGGASVGLMGALADAALSGGGTVIGVLPRALHRVELAHPSLTELHVVDSMHERKALMADLAHGFLLLPGGLGSLEEAFEVWTWCQLGIHRKPIGALNVAGFYDRLDTLVDHLVAEAFVKPVHRRILITDEDPARLVERLLEVEVPVEDKWIET